MNLLGNENGSSSQTNSNSWKAIWSGPGSTFSKVTAVLVVGVIGYGFVKALPWLISAASNTLFFVGEVAVLILLISMLTSKRFWMCIGLGWRLLTKKILGFFVKIDPISILENNIAELYEQLEIVKKNVTKLGSVLIEMQSNLRKYKAEFTSFIRKRDAAKKMLENPNLTPEQAMEIKSGYILTCNNITRLENLIKNQQKRIDVAEKYDVAMKKLNILAKMKVEDTEYLLKYQKEEYKAAKAQMSALNSIKAIMNGNVGGLEFDMAVEHINETVATATAQMRELLDGSNDLLVHFDLETYANLDKVEDIVNRFEESGWDYFKTDSSGKGDVIDMPFIESGKPALENQSMDSKMTFSTDLEKIPAETNKGKTSDKKRYF